jgi:chlorophyll synthase
MANLASTGSSPALPSASATLELLKPITWFPPMWAFGCGIVSSGAPLLSNWTLLLAGIALSGPLVCGTSQAVNDWYDRHVDAINEPNRPIPSGRIPGRWGFYIAIIWSIVSLIVAAFIGLWVFYAAVFGLLAAWAYSMPPFRLKANGWWGNAAVGLCYEGLPWFTGAAALLGGLPAWPILILALLYSLGAHGIMTLNDFKAIEGDTRMGVRSLPVQLGVAGAARTACIVMAVPQVIVIGLLANWDRLLHAAGVAVLLAVQLVMMRRFLSDPMAKALWYSGFGVPLYVLGMLVSAFAVRGVTGGL